MENEKINQTVEILSAMAHPARLKAIRFLVKAGPNGASAGDISQHLGQQPSAASFHLSSLSDAGLITATRDARRIIYRADFDALGALMGYLVQDCCGGNSKVVQCC